MVSAIVTERVAEIGILTGPTATGKSSLALALAQRFPGIEIINADSLLVYRGMDIGTAKPSQQEREKVPHHLIDVCNPDETFTAGAFVRGTEALISEIEARGNRALIVGGTGFYLKALLFGLWEAPAANPKIREKLDQNSNSELFQALTQLDPESAQRIGLQDRYRLIRALEIYELIGKTPSDLKNQANSRPDPRFSLWVIDREQEDLLQRISLRTQLMMQQGFIAEVQALASRYPESRALKSVGYAQVLDHLAQKVPQGRLLKPGLAGLVDEIELATRQLAKQQRTWFRNLLPQVPQSSQFLLDADLAKLEEVFESVYGGESRHKSK